MRLLITGGAGCLGTNLLEKYLPLGHEIFVIDNFVTGKKEALPPVNRLRVVEGTIADSGLVKNCFDQFKPTHVIHSAASYKDPNNWVEDTLTNVIGTINVAKASAENGVQCLINFQTALCYGRPQKLPIPVEHPTAPFTSYGISKAAGEAYLLNSNLKVISLRLANICGPRLAIGPIPTFYKRLKAGQACFCSDTKRDFLDMEDFLSLIDITLKQDAPAGVYNISSGKGNSIKDVYEEVASYLGIDAPEVPVVAPGNDDVQEVVLDPELTERELGWKAKFDFKATIRRQLDWYDKYGVNDIYSHLAFPPSKT